MDFDPSPVPVVPTPFTAPRFCFNVTLIDDSLEEETEEFTIDGSITFSQLSVTFDPAMTTVRILDDELTIAPATTDPVTDMPTDTTTLDESSITASPSTTQGMHYSSQ